MRARRTVASAVMAVATAMAACIAVDVLWGGQDDLNWGDPLPAASRPSATPAPAGQVSAVSSATPSRGADSGPAKAKRQPGSAGPLAAQVAALTLIPGDANEDGIVDMADYTSWFGGFGKTGASWGEGDFSGDGLVDMADYVIWFNNFGRNVNWSFPAEPVLETPTLRCLGVYWIIRGDENANSRVDVAFRPTGTTAWKGGYPLFRVEKNPIHDPYTDPGFHNKLVVPADSWLLAGSIISLTPDTAYDIRLTLTDPDGGGTERILQGRTIAEPTAPAGMRTLHVAPGSGGGDGSAGNPFKGLSAAQSAARPGDLMLVHSGTYSGAFVINKNGQPGNPIIWRGAGDGEAVLTAPGDRIIDASGAKCVWFEKLSLRNGTSGIKLNNASTCVVRRCTITGVDYGVNCTVNDTDNTRGLFISDNVIVGPCVWPRSQGIENPRGIQVTGAGHVVCYNRVRGFADAIDVYPSQRNEAIDFHNNELSELTDDGMEMDYSQRNTRCFNNRITNAYQGISCQPLYGGPTYIFRNAMYNICVETFKLHNSPSGAIILHNTSVKKDGPLLLWTSLPVYNCVYRNNLFIGSAPSSRAFDCSPTMNQCDFDYDGFGGTWTSFLKWNGVLYTSIADAKARAPVYHNAVAVPNNPFASNVAVPADSNTQFDISVNDLRLKAGTPAIDSAQMIPNFGDGYAGAAPDLGAYELGATMPQYGPRPE